MSSLHDRIQRSRLRNSQSRSLASGASNDDETITSVSTTRTRDSSSSINGRNLAQSSSGSLKSPSFDSSCTSETSNPQKHLRTVADRKAALLKQRRRRRRFGSQTESAADQSVLSKEETARGKPVPSGDEMSTGATAKTVSLSVNPSFSNSDSTSRLPPPWKKAATTTSDSAPSSSVSDPNVSNNDNPWKTMQRTRRPLPPSTEGPRPPPSWAKNDSNGSPSTASSRIDEGAKFSSVKNASSVPETHSSSRGEGASDETSKPGSSVETAERQPNPWRKLQSRRRRVPDTSSKPAEKKKLASWIKPIETSTPEAASLTEDQSVLSVQTGAKSEPVRPLTSDMKVQKAPWTPSRSKASSRQWANLDDSDASWTGSPTKTGIVKAPSWAKSNQEQSNQIASPRSVGSNGSKSSTSWIKPKPDEDVTTRDEKLDPCHHHSLDSGAGRVKAPSWTRSTQRQSIQLTSPRSVGSNGSRSSTSWIRPKPDEDTSSLGDTLSPSSQYSLTSDTGSVKTPSLSRSRQTQSSQLGSPRSVGSNRGRGSASWIKPKPDEVTSALSDTLSPSSHHSLATDSKSDTQKIGGQLSPRSIGSSGSRRSAPWTKASPSGMKMSTSTDHESQMEVEDSRSKMTVYGNPVARASVSSNGSKTSPSRKSSRLGNDKRRPSSQPLKAIEASLDTHGSDTRFSFANRAINKTSPSWAMPLDPGDSSVIDVPVGAIDEQAQSSESASGTNPSKLHPEYRATTAIGNSAEMTTLRPTVIGQRPKDSSSAKIESLSLDGSSEKKVTYGGAVIETPKSSSVANIRAAFQKGTAPPPPSVSPRSRMLAARPTHSQPSWVRTQPAAPKSLDASDRRTHGEDQRSTKQASVAPYTSPDERAGTHHSLRHSQQQTSPVSASTQTPRISNQNPRATKNSVTTEREVVPPESSVIKPAPPPLDISSISLERPIGEGSDETYEDAPTEVSVPISLTQMAAESAFAIDFSQFVSEGSRTDSYDDEASQQSSGTGVGKVVPALKDLPVELRQIMNETWHDERMARAAPVPRNLETRASPTKVSFADRLPSAPSDEVATSSYDVDGSFETDWPATDEELSFSPKASFEDSSRDPHTWEVSPPAPELSGRSNTDKGASHFSAVFFDLSTSDTANVDGSTDVLPVPQHSLVTQGRNEGAGHSEETQDFDESSPVATGESLNIASPDDEIPMDYADEIGAFPRVARPREPASSPPPTSVSNRAIPRAIPEKGILRRKASSGRGKKAVRFSENFLSKSPTEDDSTESESDRSTEVHKNGHTTFAKEELDTLLANGFAAHFAQKTSDVKEEASQDRSSAGAFNVLKFWTAPSKDELDEAADFADQDPDLDMNDSMLSLRDRSPSPDTRMIPNEEAGADVDALEGWRSPLRTREAPAFDPFGQDSDDEVSAFDFEQVPRERRADNEPAVGAQSSKSQAFSLKPPRQSPSSHKRRERLNRQQAYDDYYAMQAMNAPGEREARGSKLTDNTLEI